MPSWNDNTANLPDREAAIRAESNIVVPSFKYMDDPKWGIAGDGTTDDSTAVQALIDSADDGSYILCGRRYLCKTEIDLVGRKSLRFVGMGGFTYVDAASYGTQFIAGTESMTLFNVDNTSSLIQEGPTFEFISFQDSVGDVTFVDVGNTTFWGFYRCSFKGTSTTTRTKCGVLISNAASDSNYWFIRDCAFIRCGPSSGYVSGSGGLVITATNQQGGQISGGAWQGCYPCVDIQTGQGLRIDGAYFGPGPGVRDAGTKTSIVNTRFETVSGVIGYEAVTGASAPSLTNCTFSGPGTGWKVDSGIFGAQVVAPQYVSGIGANYVDSGSNTLIIRGITGSTPWSSVGGVGFFVGTGSPAGVVTAPVGSLFLRSDGGTSTTMYVKESGVGNTGWVAK